MADSYDSFGASRFPLGAKDNAGAIVTAAAQYDPGADAIAQFLKAAIIADCSAAWEQLLTTVDTTSFLLSPEASPVMDVLVGVEPKPENLTQRKQGWPLLAVYRDGEPSIEEGTTEYLRLKQTWNVLWVIGPLGPDTQRKVGQFFVQVRNAIIVAIRQGYHPAYQNGVKQFWGIFSEIRPVTVGGPGNTEPVGLNKPTSYYGGEVQLESIERMTYQSGAELATFESFTGYSPPAGGGYGDASDTTQPVLVDQKIEGG